MNLYLKVETLPGTPLNLAIQDAKDLSQRIGIGIELRFNGIPLLITASSETESISKLYDKSLLLLLEQI